VRNVVFSLAEASKDWTPYGFLHAVNIWVQIDAPFCSDMKAGVIFIYVFEVWGGYGVAFLMLHAIRYFFF